MVTIPLQPQFQTIKEYAGIDKAAILMLSIPDDQIQLIFKKLEPEEIKEISAAMVNLGPVKSKVVEELCVLFAHEMASSGSLVGSAETTERLLGRILTKEEAESIMEDIRGPAGRTIWDKLGNVNEEILAKFLKNEYPQTVAVVLSKIKAKSAAEVLANLPDTLATEVIHRMLLMENVRKELLEDIEFVLKKEFMSNISKGSKRDTYELVAELFNNLDRSSETRLFKNLEEISLESVEKIRRLMFTFEDVAALDDPTIQLVMKNVDRAKLALALKGAQDSIVQRFLKNMSDRASKLMKDEMQNMGKVRLKDVELAQNAIVAATKEMANRGEISIVKADTESGDQLVG